MLISVKYDNNFSVYVYYIVKILFKTCFTLVRKYLLCPPFNGHTATLSSRKGIYIGYPHINVHSLRLSASVYLLTEVTIREIEFMSVATCWSRRLVRAENIII